MTVPFSDLRTLWQYWNSREGKLRAEDCHSKASSIRVCMEDLERLIERNGGQLFEETENEICSSQQS